MAIDFGAGSVGAPESLPTTGVGSGTLGNLLRACEPSGSWGAATACSAPARRIHAVSVDATPMVNFLATPAPNPLRATAMVRIGPARVVALK